MLKPEAFINTDSVTDFKNYIRHWDDINWSSSGFFVVDFGQGFASWGTFKK